MALFSPKIKFGGKKEMPSHVAKQFRDKLVLWKQGTFPKDDARFGAKFFENKAKYEKQFNNGVVIQWGQDKGKSFNETSIEDQIVNDENSKNSLMGGLSGLLAGNNIIVVVALVVVGFFVFKRK